MGQGDGSWPGSNVKIVEDGSSRVLEYKGTEVTTTALAGNGELLVEAEAVEEGRGLVIGILPLAEVNCEVWTLVMYRACCIT